MGKSTIALDASKFTPEQLESLVKAGLAKMVWRWRCHYCPARIISSVSRKDLEARIDRHNKRCKMQKMIGLVVSFCGVDRSEAMHRLYPEDERGRPVYPNPFYRGKCPDVAAVEAMKKERKDGQAE
jgi:hypothetical protein